MTEYISIVCRTPRLFTQVWQLLHDLEYEIEDLYDTPKLGIWIDRSERDYGYYPEDTMSKLVKSMRSNGIDEPRIQADVFLQNYEQLLRY